MMHVRLLIEESDSPPVELTMECLPAKGDTLALDGIKFTVVEREFLVADGALERVHLSLKPEDSLSVPFQT